MRLLIVSGRVLYPANTGGRIRSTAIFERLAKRHDVTMTVLVSPLDAADDVARMERCCTRLLTFDWTEARPFTLGFFLRLAANLPSALPYNVAKYKHAGLMRELARRLTAESYDLLLCDFLHPSVNCLDLAYRPKVLFQHNLEAMLRSRHVAHASNPVARAYLSWDLRRLRRFEARAVRHFDHTIMVSAEDCRALQHAYGVASTSAVPTGVDADYFQPPAREAAAPDLVFTGSMDWAPNQDGIERFVAQTLPLIRARVPAARLWVVGRNPSASLVALGARHDAVTVTGTVDDIRPYLSRAQVYVVPLRVGGGTRIKILEALAMGLPVVSTRLGAEGLPFVDGEHLQRADTPGEMAGAIIHLLEDGDARRRLGQAGRAAVVARHSWDHVTDVFSRTLEQVVEAHARPTR